jgi:hypothetical protein
MAGTIHGINDSTKFALYDQPDKNGRFLGFFAVHKPKEFTSTLMITDSTTNIPIAAYAVPIKVLRVAFSNKPGISAVADALRREVAVTESKSHQYSFVPRDEAAVEVDISEGWVVFNNVHPRVQALGYSRMPYRVKMGENHIISSILEAFGDFDLFLNLTSEDKRIRDHIMVEFIEVMRPRDEQYGPAIRRESTQDLCEENIVDVTAGKTTYGIQITNKSPFHLYPHLFLFDCSDLSIGKHHSIRLNLKYSPHSQSLTISPQ